MRGRLTLLAPPKVNLYLAVGRRRADGYHDLTTVFQCVDAPADIVTIEPGRALSIALKPDIGVAPEDNLAYRAAEALGAAAGREPAVAISIEKRIPHGGGLGGASADAAAVLIGLCEMWGVDPASEMVRTCARSLGADVPFLLQGGTALFVGRGDVLAKALPTPEAAFVLVNPGEPVPTAVAYALLDRLLQPAAPQVQPMLDAIAERDTARIAALLHNDLAEAARTLVDSIREVESWLARQDGVLGASVTGSGSTVFGVCRGLEAAQRVAARAATREWWACACSASPDGVRLIDRA